MGARTLVFLAFLAGLGAVALAADGPGAEPAFHEESGKAWHRFRQHLEEWASRLRDHFDFAQRHAERPLITFMLEHREKLRLQSDQVERLERLRDEFRRQAIRAEADLKVAELDLDALLKKEPVDLKKVEGKIREIEKIKADLRLLRVRTVEEGKALLSAEQREKLRELLPETKREHARVN
ncbi:MAG TPA: hypothetical protein VNL14_13110 [Candidatus Acidoferrales bacterium]|nr:hypothetical protein [Candidatus Acidoferrales bacterium]